MQITLTKIVFPQLVSLSVEMLLFHFCVSTTFLLKIVPLITYTQLPKKIAFVLVLLCVLLLGILLLILDMVTGYQNVILSHMVSI